MVQDLMCRGGFKIDRLKSSHPFLSGKIDAIVRDLSEKFPDALEIADNDLTIRPDAESLTRVIASAATSEQKSTGSLAI
jgi:hypothetical protein